MAENRVEANAHNAGGCPASNAIHGHINDFLVRTGLRGGVSERYTVFHEQTETFSSLWSEYHDDFRQFLHIYSQDVACYGENLAYFPKGFIENMFFVSANPWVSFTSFDLNVANMDNFFAPVFTMGKYYTQGDKVLMPLAIQVHHAVCDGFHVGRMLNELQQYCDEWQGGA